MQEENLTQSATRVRDHLESQISDLNGDTQMAFFYIQDVSGVLGEEISPADFKAGIEAVRDKSWQLVCRGPDDFSSTPCAWVSPLPLAASASGETGHPDPCWIIRSPDGRASRRVKEGLLVFSQPGFATSCAVADGMGDFDVVEFAWAELVERGGKTYRFAVIDHVDGFPMRLVPLE